MADIDLLWPQGVDFAVSFPVVGQGDIYGFSATCEVRVAEDHTSELLETLTCTVLENSTVRIAIPGDTSINWDWDFGYYDIKLKNPSGGAVQIAAQGTIIVDPVVTDS